MRRPAGNSSLIGRHLKSGEKRTCVSLWGRAFQAEEQEGGFPLGLNQRETMMTERWPGPDRAQSLQAPVKTGFHSKRDGGSLWGLRTARSDLCFKSVTQTHSYSLL